jgi:protein-S-isoprenylcysteine O-methyltransferase Ste14
MHNQKGLNSFLSRFKYFDVVVYVLVSAFIFWYFWRSSLNNYIGLFLWVVGFFIWMRGLYDLGGSFGLLAVAKKLVTAGIYSRIRHPIYFGGFVLVAGLGVYSLHWFFVVFALLFLIVQCQRTRREESVLLKKFGARYVRYKKQTWF